MLTYSHALRQKKPQENSSHLDHPLRSDYRQYDSPLLTSLLVSLNHFEENFLGNVHLTPLFHLLLTLLLLLTKLHLPSNVTAIHVLSNILPHPG